MTHPRLAYLVSRYPAISHTFILREVLALRDLGFDIEVASINPGGAAPAGWTAQEKAETERTYCVKQTPKTAILATHLRGLLRHPGRYFAAGRYALRFGGYGLFYFVEAVLLAGWMERHRLTHLHVHFATPAASVGLILTRFAPVTMSITVHGPDEFYDVSSYHLTEKIEGAAFLCAIGSFARSQLMKLSDPAHWDKLEVTPLGVDPAQFAPRPFRRDPERFEILCVGRLTPAKGQHILLRALRRIRDARPGVLLRFVGDGPDRESLEQATARLGLTDCVRFEGAVNQDRIRAFYDAADLFALASFAEGIPVVLMEAMAMTVPCVSTCITGIPELIRDGIDGLLVPASDDEGLAAAILRLIEDPDMRRRLGCAGRQRVIEKYDLARNIDRLAEVFDRRLGAAR
jgi:glycosyltransferase involved in cell wall biosynthesis